MARYRSTFWDPPTRGNNRFFRAGRCCSGDLALKQLYTCQGHSQLALQSVAGGLSHLTDLLRCPQCRRVLAGVEGKLRIGSLQLLAQPIHLSV